MPLAFLTLKCVSGSSWADAVTGKTDFILMAHAVPRFVPFRVYFGKRRLPRMVDCKNAFVPLGCEKVGKGRYRVRVKVRTKRPVI